MNICFLGNSQLLPVKEYYDRYKHLKGSTAKYFSSSNSSYDANTIEADPKEGTVCARGEFIKKAWKNSAGAEQVDIGQYDFLVLYGFDQFEEKNVFLVSYSESFVSDACRQQQLKDMLETHPAHVALKRIREAGVSLPVLVMNGPLFSLRSARLANVSKRRDFSEAREIYEAFWIDLCAEFGATFLPQPRETIDVNGITTKQEFVQDDGFHLNDSGTGVFSTHLLSVIDEGCR